MNLVYRNQEIDTAKTFGEIIDKNDKNKGIIEINVEEKNIIDEKGVNKINDESCFKNNKKRIILISLIISIILVIILILILVLVLKKKKKR